MADSDCTGGKIPASAGPHGLLIPRAASLAGIACSLTAFSEPNRLEGETMRRSRISRAPHVLLLAAVLLLGEQPLPLDAAEPSGQDQTKAQAEKPSDNAGHAGQPSPSTEEATGKKKASTFYTADGQLMAAKLIGATISNDQKQQIGSIADVLLDKEGKAVTAVLSVGGFLGVGSRQVAVPFNRLDIGPDRIVVPGATKVSLENLPAYDPNSS